MSDLLDEIESVPITVQMRPAVKMSDDQFFRFCVQNENLRIERNANGELVMMHPEGVPSSAANARLSWLFVGWADRDGRGTVFGSSAGFTLPNGAIRSPDVAWVLNRRLAKLTSKERQQFAPLCPDFVLELRSRTDSLSALQRKMEEYLENGARLGWLLDPVKQRVFVYRPGAAVEELVKPAKVSGEPVLRGFVLEPARVWKVIRAVGG